MFAESPIVEDIIEYLLEPRRLYVTMGLQTGDGSRTTGFQRSPASPL
jgi:hypothetical protein